MLISSWCEDIQWHLIALGFGMAIQSVLLAFHNATYMQTSRVRKSVVLLEANIFPFRPEQWNTDHSSYYKSPCIVIKSSICVPGLGLQYAPLQFQVDISGVRNIWPMGWVQSMEPLDPMCEAGGLCCACAHAEPSSFQFSAFRCVRAAAASPCPPASRQCSSDGFCVTSEVKDFACTNIWARLLGCAIPPPFPWAPSSSCCMGTAPASGEVR